MQAIYDQLAEKFDETHTDVRGGVALTYITGEQVVDRLNTVLGFRWSFTVIEHGWHESTDEEWVLGRLTVTLGDLVVVREQYGSQKRNKTAVRRAPNGDTIPARHIEIGFDMKGAATDALKKCAQMIGVGLYLSHRPTRQQGVTPFRNVPASVPASEDCSVCGKPAKGVPGATYRSGKYFCPEHAA